MYRSILCTKHISQLINLYLYYHAILGRIDTNLYCQDTLSENSTTAINNILSHSYYSLHVRVDSQIIVGKSQVYFVLHAITHLVPFVYDILVHLQTLTSTDHDVNTSFRNIRFHEYYCYLKII